MARILTKNEEYLLLAVIKLKNNAWANPIFEEIWKTTGEFATIEAIYLPLQRLEDRGLLSAFLGNMASTLGEKSRKHYRITEAGLKALAASRQAHEGMWRGIEWAAIR